MVGVNISNLSRFLLNRSRHDSIPEGSAADADADTVQISNATSPLGMYLLEGDWGNSGHNADEGAASNNEDDDDTDHVQHVLEYLSTPEGHADVLFANDPLGLFPSQKTEFLNKFLPSKQTSSSSSFRQSAFFAGLYVRAPLPIMKAIYKIDREKLLQKEKGKEKSMYCVCDWWTECLMCLLSVIPSKDEERFRSGDAKSILFRTRTWSQKEFEELIQLLLGDYPAAQSTRSCSNSPLPSLSNTPSNFSSFPESPLLKLSPKWIIHAPTVVSLTPLAIAAYNPDVPPEILQLLHNLEPRAIHTNCTLFGIQTIPIHVAAASPLPSKAAVSSEKYDMLKEKRWRKVETLMVLSDQSGDCNAPTILSKEENHCIMQPTVKHMQRTCQEAIQREEWELVREILKRYYSMEKVNPNNTRIPNLERSCSLEKHESLSQSALLSSMSMKCKLSESSPSLVPTEMEEYHNALLQHDVKVQSIQSNLYQEAKEREEEHQTQLLGRNNTSNNNVLRNVGLARITSLSRMMYSATERLPTSFIQRNGRNSNSRVWIRPGVVEPMS